MANQSAGLSEKTGLLSDKKKVTNKSMIAHFTRNIRTYKYLMSFVLVLIYIPVSINNFLIPIGHFYTTIKSCL